MDIINKKKFIKMSECLLKTPITSDLDRHFLKDLN